MQELLSWTASRGGGLHPSVEAVEDPASGWGFQVKRDQADSGNTTIKAGDTVVKCPLGVTMSYLNLLKSSPSFIATSEDASSSFMAQFTRDTHPFPDPFLASVPPHVTSRFFLIKEYLLGESSFWHPYIRSLPQPDRLASWALPPAGWATDDLEMLDETNVGNAVQEVKQRLKLEFRKATDVLEAFERENGGSLGNGVPSSGEYTRLLYNWAYSIFTSRSFRPSRVVPEGDLPRLKSCLPGETQVDDFAVLMPLFDIGNHSPLAEVDWGFEQPVAAGDESPTSTIVNLNNLTMAYLPGQQIFNNYGDKTNAELLMAYGFVVPETEALHNDYVHVRLRAPDAGTTEKPREYLLSLRPVADESSPVARKRLLVPELPPQDVLPAFQRVDQALIWELVSLQTTPEQRATLMPVSDALQGQENHDLRSFAPGNIEVLSISDRERLKLVLTGKASPEFRPIMEMTLAMIQAKAMQEFEKLEESDFDFDEDAELTRTQTLAYTYRRQCQRVLAAVLESLEMPDEE